MIESKENKKIKYIKRLRENKFMKEEKKFVVEGEHLVKEAYSAGILLETFSVKEVSYGVLNNLITNNIMANISTLKSKPDVIAICKFMDENEKLGDKIIILDNVQDPGNIGTIIRSARAFNINNVVLGLNCANKYNDKLIRASEGMIFKQSVLIKELKYFITYLKGLGYDVYGTDVSDGIDIRKVSKKRKIALVMGNEGSGVSSDVKALLDKNVYIKTSSDCESLNVAAAASILMYEVAKGDE